MEPISASLALAPLVIDWAKERRSQGNEITERAFREWLKTVAFPELLESSHATLNLLSAGQKAHQAELFRYLDEQFEKITGTLEQLQDAQGGSDSLEDRWNTLGPAARDLLETLVAQVQESSYEDAQIEQPVKDAGASHVDEFTRGCKRLAEKGLVACHSYSGGAFIRLTGMGYLVTVAIGDLEAFDAQLLRIQSGVRQYQCLPVDKIVAASLGRCTAPLVYAVMERWDALGWVSLQKLDQRERSRIMQPAQSLMDADARTLRKKTLEPFLHSV
jgi:hypothetical protein